MNKKARFLVNAAVTAAIYVALTHLQNFLLPGSATWFIQFRIAEALCILAYFTPAAIPGLAVGCLLFNITYAGALPLDFLVGTVATYLASKATCVRISLGSVNIFRRRSTIIRIIICF